jgi:ATP-dependent Lon protease
LPIEKIKIAQKYLIPRFEGEYGFTEVKEVDKSAEPTTTVQTVGQEERIKITDAALIRIVNQYCGHEAGVRNLRKCLDRIFRKIVAKMEDKLLTSPSAQPSTLDVTLTEAGAEAAHHAEPDVTQPTLYKAELPSRVVKEYQVNTRNLERFLDVAPTDDHYYSGIN